MAFTQPVSDFKLSLTPDPLTGNLVIDLPLAPSGDLQLVSGTQRLVQMIVLWLLTPIGSDPFNPDYGNPLFAELGRPGTNDEGRFLSMLDQCEADFLARQGNAAAQGYLSTDELVQSFSNRSVTFPQPGIVYISLTVNAQSGKSQSVILPFTATASS